jgi:hypothetical protein
VTRDWNDQFREKVRTGLEKRREDRAVGSHHVQLPNL